MTKCSPIDRAVRVVFKTIDIIDIYFEERAAYKNRMKCTMTQRGAVDWACRFISIFRIHLNPPQCLDLPRHKIQLELRSCAFSS